MRLKIKFAVIVTLHDWIFGCLKRLPVPPHRHNRRGENWTPDKFLPYKRLPSKSQTWFTFLWIALPTELLSEIERGWIEHPPQAPYAKKRVAVWTTKHDSMSILRSATKLPLVKCAPYKPPRCFSHSGMVQPHIYFQRTIQSQPTTAITVKSFLLRIKFFRNPACRNLGFPFGRKCCGRESNPAMSVCSRLTICP